MQLRIDLFGRASELARARVGDGAVGVDDDGHGVRLAAAVEVEHVAAFLAVLVELYLILGEVLRIPAHVFEISVQIGHGGLLPRRTQRHKYGGVGVFRGKIEQCGQFLDARSAGGVPEVEDDRLALALFADRLGEGEFLAVHAGDGEVGAGVAHLAAHRLRGIGVEEVVVDERSDEHRRHEHIDDRL